MLIRVSRPYPKQEGLVVPEHLTLVSYIEALQVTAIADNANGKIIRAYLIRQDGTEQEIAIDEFQFFALEQYRSHPMTEEVTIPTHAIALIKDWTSFEYVCEKQTDMLLKAVRDPSSFTDLSQDPCLYCCDFRDILKFTVSKQIMLYGLSPENRTSVLIPNSALFQALTDAHEIYEALKP
jgi:hypothetical protein